MSCMGCSDGACCGCGGCGGCGCSSLDAGRSSFDATRPLLLLVVVGTWLCFRILLILLLGRLLGRLLLLLLFSFGLPSWRFFFSRLSKMAADKARSAWMALRGRGSLTSKRSWLESRSSLHCSQSFSACSTATMAALDWAGISISWRTWWMKKMFENGKTKW